MNTGTGIALGLAFGVALWLTLDNVALLGAGLAIGTALGVALDTAKKQGSDEAGGDNGESGKA